MNKPWYQSWTIWFNLLVFAIAVIHQLAGIIPISPVVLGYADVIGNILLRFKTDSGINLTTPTA